MEFKKKTIIWEDNNEPPKDYIWVKSDGKAYEYSYSQRKWIESKSISGGSGGSDGGGGGSDVDINTILDNISIKDDLLTKLQAVDYTNQDVGDVLTDLTFDDVFNDYDDFIKSCLYREESPAISNILFPQGTVQKTNDYLAFMIGDEDAFYYVTVAIVDNDIKIYAMKQENHPK